MTDAQGARFALDESNATQLAREALDLIHAEPQSFKPAQVRTALDQLAQAVLDGPRDYASLPLAVRAPEIAQLVAQLPADEWGADELATLGNWLGGHGYDTGSEDE